MGIMTILSAIGKIIEAVPMQGRIERYKNQLENLKKERMELLTKGATKESTKRLSDVMVKIEKLNQTLKNYAKD